MCRKDGEISRTMIMDGSVKTYVHELLQLLSFHARGELALLRSIEAGKG